MTPEEYQEFMRKMGFFPGHYHNPGGLFLQHPYYGYNETWQAPPCTMNEQDEDEVLFGSELLAEETDTFLTLYNNGRESGMSRDKAFDKASVCFGRSA